MTAQGLTPPRIGTPRSKAKSLGPIARQVALDLGVEWWPWQRHVTDISMELTRRKSGRSRFRASTVGVIVPRQQGKSVTARVRGIMQCLLPDLDGVEQLIGGTVGAQHVGWLAQDRANAVRPWLDALDWLMASPYADRIRRVRQQRGDECITFKSGSTLRVVTPSRTGARGLSLDLILLDEALAHESALLAALAPTQAQRDRAIGSLGAQLVVLSTEGDERSTLLANLGEVGRRAVAEGDRSRMWFEWSAVADADPYDEAVWRATIPTLDRPGGVSTEFIRMQAETMDLEDFRREFLCLHTPRPAAQVVDPEKWATAPYGAPSHGALVFAVDITPSGSSASIVAVGTGDQGHAVELIEARGGVDWLTSAIIDKAKRWDAPVVLDAAGPAAWLAPTLDTAQVEVIKVRAGDVLAAASRFAVLVDEGMITHQHDPRFEAAVESAKRRHSGDRWGFDRHSGDVSALVAAALGVWAIETNVVSQAQVW